jgi:hypothetical protein
VVAVSFEVSGGTLANQVIATATPTIYGWAAQWNTASVPNGTYTLHSVASLGSVPSGTSPAVTIAVVHEAAKRSVPGGLAHRAVDGEPACRWDSESAERFTRDCPVITSDVVI